MRQIIGHEVNACNAAITIEADERDPTYGNASHEYKISVMRKSGMAEVSSIDFQHGPIKEVGPNGITHEVLLAILIDRMEGFQSGPFACEENEEAKIYLEKAREVFFSRTRARMDRGVEGTHVV